MGLVSLHEKAASIAVASALGLLLNLAVTRRNGPRYFDDLGDGLRWNYYVSMFYQYAVFPPLWAWRVWAVGGCRAWVMQPYAECAYADHVPLFVFAGYMIKDLAWGGLSARLQAHHWVCLLCTLGSISGDMAYGHNVFVAGAFAMEIGSLSSAACQVFPRSALFARLLVPVMAASNACGAWAAYGFFYLETYHQKRVCRAEAGEAEISKNGRTNRRARHAVTAYSSRSAHAVHSSASGTSRSCAASSRSDGL